jgi:hypothetical protein
MQRLNPISVFFTGIGLLMTLVLPWLTRNMNWPVRASVFRSKWVRPTRLARICQFVALENAGVFALAIGLNLLLPPSGVTQFIGDVGGVAFVVAFILGLPFTLLLIVGKLYTDIPAQDAHS